MKLLLSSLQLPAGADLEAAQMCFNMAVSFIAKMNTLKSPRAQSNAQLCQTDLHCCKSANAY